MLFFVTVCPEVLQVPVSVLLSSVFPSFGEIFPVGASFVVGQALCLVPFAQEVQLFSVIILSVCPDCPF